MLLLGGGLLRVLARVLVFVRAIPGIRPPCVILQLADKLAVDTKATGNDSHIVQREGARLVRTDDRCVRHGLARSKNTNEQVLLRHPFGSEGQSEGDGERKTLGDGDDDKGGRNNEDIDESNAFLAGLQR